MNIPFSNLNQVPRFRKAQVKAVPAAVTAAVTRGVSRWLEDMGYSSLTEFKLGNGRRADVVGLNGSGTILMVEVKSTPEDFRGDAKWLEYVPYCDGFSFAVPPHFPGRSFPRPAVWWWPMPIQLPFYVLRRVSVCLR